MIKRLSFSDICLYTYCFLFPILPEFTQLLGRPIYDWVTIVFAICTLFNRRFILKKDKFSKYILFSVFLYVLMYGYHGEWRSIIGISLVCFIPMLCVYSYINSIEKIRSVLYCLIWGGFILCLESILEYFLGFNIFSLIQTLPSETIMGAGVLSSRYGHARAEATFGTTAVFAMYLLFINMISVLLYFDSKKNKLRLKMIVPLVYGFSLVSMVFTSTRMVIMLTIILQVIVFLLLDTKKKILIILLGLFALIIAGVLFKDSESLDLLDTVYSLISVFNSNAYSKVSDGGQNVSYRLYLFNALGEYIKEKPIWGWGAQFMNGFSFDMVTSVTSWRATSIDNNYLSYLITYGVVGLIADINIIITVLFIAYGRMKKSENKNKTIFALIFSITVLYLAHLFSVYQMGEKRLAFILVTLFWSYIKITKVEKYNGNGIRKTINEN